jgi:hypothetical protein
VNGYGGLGTQPLGTRRVYKREFTVNGATHDHRLGQITVTQNHSLTTNEMAHSHRLETVSVTQNHNFTTNDLRHPNRLDVSFLVNQTLGTQNPPSQDRVERMSFGLLSGTGRSESPFTLNEKTFEYHAQRWVGKATLVGLDFDEIAPWKGWIASLEGKLRDFKLDAPRQEPRGAVSQNGTVDSFSRPRQLTISGLSANKSEIFRRGDYIEIVDTNELKMVVEDAASDASGKATVTIEPLLRSDPSGSTVETQSPQGLFQFVNNDPSWTTNPSITDISFEFVEVVSDGS